MVVLVCMSIFVFPHTYLNVRVCAYKACANIFLVHVRVSLYSRVRMSDYVNVYKLLCFHHVFENVYSVFANFSLCMCSCVCVRVRVYILR